MWWLIGAIVLQSATIVVLLRKGRFGSYAPAVAPTVTVLDVELMQVENERLRIEKATLAQSNESVARAAVWTEVQRNAERKRRQELENEVSIFRQMDRMRSSPLFVHDDDIEDVS